MIITCPNCATKFNLPDSKIPAGGAKVKCSKCANVFKVTPPVLEPEDEVASMLEEEVVPTPAPKLQPKSEAKAELKSKPEPAPKPEPEPAVPAEDPLDDDFFGDDSNQDDDEDLDKDLFGDLGADDDEPAVAGTDELEDDLFGSGNKDDDADLGADLFDDDEPAAAIADGEDAFDIDEELFGGDDDEDIENDAEDLAADSADEDTPEEDSFDDEDLFGDDDGTESFTEDELFGDDEEVEEESAEDDASLEEDETFVEEDDDDSFPLDDGEINDFDLDEGITHSSHKNKKGGKKKGKGMIITLIIVLLFAGGAGAAWYLKLWEKIPAGIPFISSSDNGEMDASEPPSKRFSKFSFKDLRQFYVNNDKAGQLFIIEGKVVNNFSKPKELVEVEAQLFDDKGQVLDSQRLLCGNTLSLFQLEVQSKEEIEAGLTSKVGVLSNNTLLKPGMDTPFMVVFFKPSPAVKEYVINVVEAKNPPKK